MNDSQINSIQKRLDQEIRKHERVAELVDATYLKSRAGRLTSEAKQERGCGFEPCLAHKNNDR